MIPGRDPALMSESERLSEIARVFALGYVRLLLSRRNGLELAPRPEALLVATDAGESPRKESACKTT